MLCGACVQSEADAGSEGTPAAPAHQEPPCRCPEDRNDRPPDTELARLGMRTYPWELLHGGLWMETPLQGPQKDPGPLGSGHAHAV